MKRMWIAPFIVAVFTSVFAQPTSESVPRELALRLLGSYSAQNAELYVGQLPPENRRLAQIALPEGARVVGSTVSEDSQFSSTTVYLNLAGSTEDALRFYTLRLPQADWERQQGQGYAQAGFIPAEATYPESRVFCKDDVILDVSARRADGAVNVDLNLYRADPQYSPCDPLQEPREPPVPSLRAPAESLTLDYEPAYGRYEGFGSSTIALESQLGPLELRDFYDAQLTEAGWQAQAEGQGGPITWSQWTFRARGATWSGLLTVLSEPAFPKRYLAQLVVVQR